MRGLISLKVPTGDGTSSIEIHPPAGIPHGAEFTISSLATKFVEVAMVIGVILSLIYMTYGGFYWLQSKGDKEKLDHARRIIVYSILGIIIMALSLVIVNFITSAVGVTNGAVTH